MAKSSGKKRQRDPDSIQTPPEKSQVQDEDSSPPSKKSRVEASRSLFVRSLPPSTTSETLADFFSQHYPVKHATVVLDPATKASRGYGFVTFTDPEDAFGAKEKLNNELLDGRRLRLEIAEPRHRGPGHVLAGEAPSAAAEAKRKREHELAEARKPPKLIVRNLPWSIKSADQLAALFRSYGKVRYADLPKPKGKLAGFGFVTIRGKKNAETAMEGLNGRVVDGRTLAVDWAVDKEVWEQQNAGPKPNDTIEDAVEHPTEDEIGALKAEVEPTRDANPDGEDDDLQNFMMNHMENLEDEGSNDGEDDGDIGDESEDNQARPSDEKPQLATDNSTTIFIRNLPFTTTDAELKDHFGQFGAVRYARVVMDRSTERSAGTGFVCFFNLEDFKSCLKGAPRHRNDAGLAKHSVLQNESVDHDGRYTIEGRVLQVAQAVSKEEATRLSTDGPGARNAQSRDRRHLFLLSEGTIPNNSPVYGMLAPSEIKAREASAKQRKKLIESNPSLHLSLTRLALRNVPRSIDSKALKALAREAVVEFAKDVKAGRRQALSKEEVARGGQQDREGEHRRKERRKGVVRQAKIVFESREGSKVPEQSGGGKSRGYGFVEYSSHRWALMGLRWLNGHALKNEAGKTQRLIVEFAIENAQVVNRRKSAEEKARNRVAGDTAAKGTKKTGAEHEEETSMTAKKRSKKGEASETTEAAAVESSKKGDAKLALRQKIIARKRLLRKKKAKARHGV